MFQEIFEQMGFAQAAPGVWFKEFTHPDTSSILRVDARERPNGDIHVKYSRDGRFTRDKLYWRGPKVAALAIRTIARNAGFKI